MNTKYFITFGLIILPAIADIIIENLDPILRSNNSALLYAAENCETYIHLDVDFFRPLNQMMVNNYEFMNLSLTIFLIG
jgi:hypothetical protein